MCKEAWELQRPRGDIASRNTHVVLVTNILATLVLSYFLSLWLRILIDFFPLEKKSWRGQQIQIIAACYATSWLLGTSPLKAFVSKSVALPPTVSPPSASGCLSGLINIMLSGMFPAASSIHIPRTFLPNGKGGKGTEARQSWIKILFAVQSSIKETRCEWTAMSSSILKQWHRI